MTSARWRLDKAGRLLVVKGDGSIVYPDAMEVFNHAFHGAERVAGVSCAPVALDLPELKFSPIPATPALSIDAVRGRLCSTFGILAGETFQELPCDVDQVVLNLEWFPIDAPALQSARSLAHELHAIGDDINVGALISLRASRELPFHIIERESIDQWATPTDANLRVDGLKATLYPYQEHGVAFLRMIAKQQVGCLLADEMGLGKTLQIIALLQMQLREGLGPSLVVAPATLLENWRRELEKFAPQIRVLVHAGSARAGVVSRFNGIDVVVVSYDTAIRDEPLLSSISWNCVVLDEAQAIKNPEAQRTNAVKQIPREVSIAVSGTPLENCVEDLWSVTDFCLPGILGTLQDFRQEFDDSVEDAERLSKVVGPILLRRKVVEVADDLPEKIEIPQAISIGAAMAERYESLRKLILEEYGPAGNLVAITKLRSFCAHPSLVQDWHEDPSEEMPKYERLVEILDEIFSAGEKALVFSTFQGMADMFQRDIPKRFGAGFYQSIDGRTPVDRRQLIVDQFFSYDDHGALFLNPKAAGSGLNITAANHVIHYNPEWNPALTAQASARAYRRKQTRPVTIHHLFFSSTVEEVIVNRAAFKQMLAQNAVTGHDGSVSSSELARALQISPV